MRNTAGCSAHRWHRSWAAFRASYSQPRIFSSCPQHNRRPHRATSSRPTHHCGPPVARQGSAHSTRREILSGSTAARGLTGIERRKAPLPTATHFPLFQTCCPLLFLSSRTPPPLHRLHSSQLPCAHPGSKYRPHLCAQHHPNSCPSMRALPKQSHVAPLAVLGPRAPRTLGVALQRRRGSGGAQGL